MNTVPTMIDLFAGCGGLSLGFELAGFRPLLFSEVNLNAAQTYMTNRPHTKVIPFGDVFTLTDPNLRLLSESWRYEGIGEVDIVCGGPPCQGYSGIGHRRSFDLNKDQIPSNRLYDEMVRVVRFLRPRAFLFENVRGLLSGRWTREGRKGEIFGDVLSSFKDIPGYECEWALLHAGDYGVPQNRPRVMIIGYRSDVWSAYQRVAPPVSLIASSSRLPKGSAVQRGLLPEGKEPPPDLKDLLGDLVDEKYRPGGATKRYPTKPRGDTQHWFRTDRSGKVAEKGDTVSEHEYSFHSERIIEKFRYMISNDGAIPDHMRTKKFAQRVLPREWGQAGPSITATSLPDDYVHFCQPRIPTVREWARIQTFPDWYQFVGPRTTGGRRRAGDPDAGDWDREVPKYTQIGNAVPVLLAEQVALHVRRILGHTGV